MEAELKRRTTRRIMLHVLFWAVFLGFNTFLYGFERQSYRLQFILFLHYMPVTMLATYTVMYLLIPRLLLRRRVALFAVVSIAAMLGFGALQQAFVAGYIVPRYLPEYAGRMSAYPIGSLFRVTTFLPFVAIGAAVKLARHWYRTEYLKQQAEKEKLRSELALLRAQVQPHFLFNTLNNLYALVMKKDPAAPGMVLKLSDLLDYILHECDAQGIGMEKEVALLENYIALEKLRYGERLDLSFEVSGLEHGGQLPPLLFLPLVENAFKHGTSRDSGSPWMRISLRVSPGAVEFTVENGKPPSGAPDDSGAARTGIGLQNLRKRLELLYSGRHMLHTEDRGDSYIASLVINA